MKELITDIKDLPIVFQKEIANRIKMGERQILIQKKKN